jgi:hypothetical protein
LRVVKEREINESKKIMKSMENAIILDMIADFDAY